MTNPFLRVLQRSPERPLIADPVVRARMGRRWRWSVFVSITLGYGLYYTTRLPLSVVKKPLLDEGVLDAKQLGQVGFAMLLTYAIGKTTNGFFADHLNLKRYFCTGIVLSSFFNLAFGGGESFLLFVLLWAGNGFVQSIGAPTSGVTLANWFSGRELGTRYAIWSVSHNIGEGLTFVGTSAVVAAFGWRWGFWGPALLCLAAFVVLLRTMADRPPSLGLPPVTGEADEVARAERERALTIAALQREVLGNPRVWVLGLASALMYVARYGVNNWGVLFLQLERGYGDVEAGMVIGLFPIVGALGSASSGIISDRLFRARRTPPTVLFGLLMIAGQSTFYFAPYRSLWLDRLSIGVSGFAIGGLLVFLGGLTALDICSRRAAGAALGLVGGMSYVGAGIQDWISGALLEGSRSTLGGQVSYDFTTAKYFWVGASCASLLLAASLWKHERGPDDPER